METPTFNPYITAGFKESGPWRTCNVCQARFKGNRGTAEHRRLHPVENARVFLADVKRDLARHEDDLAAWADYHAALAIHGLPERVRKMVEKEIHDYPYIMKWERRDNPESPAYGTKRVEQDIEHAKAKIAEAEAWLAANDPAKEA